MSEAKHTPGPWILSGEVKPVGNPLKDGVHSLYVGDVRHDAFIWSICTIQSADHCPPHGITREMAAANARLIAAAPDLLDVARFFLRGIEGGHIKCAPYIDFDPDAEQLEIKSPAARLREVIAKATEAQ